MWYKISSDEPKSFDFTKNKPWDISDPFKDNEKYIVYHGFRNITDAWKTLKYGLTGQVNVPRTYSYESQNNPYGLFVTLNQKDAGEFSSTFGEAVIIEFIAEGSELEAPVWPGGSYTVQGEYAQYWKGETYEEQMQDRENTRLKRREDLKSQLEKEIQELEERIQYNIDYIKYFETIENIDENTQNFLEGKKQTLQSLEADLAHKKAIYESDRPELAKTLVGPEHQALFIGDLNPEDIRAVWVRTENSEKGYMLATDPFIRMSPQEFMEKFEDKSNKDFDRKIFKPKDAFDPQKFLENMPQYLIKDLQRTATIFLENRDYLDYYFWPRQKEGAIKYFESIVGKQAFNIIRLKKKSFPSKHPFFFNLAKSLTSTSGLGSLVKTRGNDMFTFAQTEDGGKVYQANLEIQLPKTLHDVLAMLKSIGSFGLLVGGAVRDRFLGLNPKDLDVEVYGINYEKLLEVLKPFDKKHDPDVVGKSFGIIKITDIEGNEYDFSIPRRESKTGIGHQGFSVEFDPDITPKEAAARRDFTINALAYDPLEHQVYDYFGGVEDIQNKVLKATSPAFAEDPLRVLRGMQFAGRFGFSLDDETAEMTRTLIEEYPALATERVSGEWMKFFTKSKHPGKALEFLVKSGWVNLYPEINAFIPEELENELLGEFIDQNYPGIHGRREIRQEPEWHPEGGVLTHTIYVLEAAAKIADEQGVSGDDRAVLLMSALCHDLGKATHTQLEEKKGVPRVTSPGHEAAGVPIAEKFLESIGIKRELIKRVLPLVGNHMQHIDYDGGSKKGNVRQIAERLFPATIKELEMVIRSDMGGRPPLPGGLPPEAEQMVSDAQMEGVYESKYPDYLFGRDILFEFNISPGPLVGETLKYVRQKTLEGVVNDRESALMVADDYLKKKGLLLNGNDILQAMGLEKGGPFIKDILDTLWEEQKEGRVKSREEALVWLNQFVTNEENTQPQE